MKNLLFLIPFFLLTFGLNSCNSDDDSSNNVDVIVGSWKISDVKINGESVYDVLSQMPEGCFLNTQVHFYNDHTMKINPYTNVDGVCVADPAQLGTWSKEGSLYTYSMEDNTNNTIELNFVNTNQFYYSDTINGVDYELYFSRM